MTLTHRHATVLVTAPDVEVARKLVRAALEKRLAACGQILPGLESHYWWKGVLEQSGEVLVIFKTARTRLKDLESAVRQNHPYETPQVVVLPISTGSESYLKWIDAEVGKPKAPQKSRPGRGRLTR